MYILFDILNLTVFNGKKIDALHNMVPLVWTFNLAKADMLNVSFYRQWVHLKVSKTNHMSCLCETSHVGNASTMQC